MKIKDQNTQISCIPKNDTLNASIISENDILKFFNLERNSIKDFSITHKSDGLYISVTLNVKPHQCPICGQLTTKIKDYQEKKIVHSVLTSKNCYIIYRARRYRCPHCHKIFYEHNPFTFGSSRISVATVYNILQDLKAPNETFVSVALRHHVSPTTAVNIFDQHVHMSRRPLPSCLAMDEVYAFKSHNSQYVCVLVDYLDKKIIDVLPSRHKDTLMNYFMLIPLEERKKVKFCSFDMWESFRIVANHVFPNVRCAVDHFHVIQDLNRRVDRVRLSVQKKYQKTVNELNHKKKCQNGKLSIEDQLALEEASRHYYVFKKFNWLLYSSNSKILDNNMEKRFNRRLGGYYNYSDLYDYMIHSSSDLETACNLQYEVKNFYEHCNEKSAKEKIEELIIDFRSCPVDDVSQFANVLTKWKREIINSFIIVDSNKGRKMNTAIVENRNKSIKLIKHASNGYLNWERFRNRILFSLNADSTFYMTNIKKEKKQQ